LDLKILKVAPDILLIAILAWNSQLKEQGKQGLVGEKKKNISQGW